MKQWVEFQVLKQDEIDKNNLLARLKKGLLYKYSEDSDSDFEKLDEINYGYQFYKKIEYIECGTDTLRCKFKIDYNEVEFQVLEQDERLRKGIKNLPKIWIKDEKYEICVLHKPQITKNKLYIGTLHKPQIIKNKLYIRGEDRCDDYKPDKIVVESNEIAREMVFTFCSLIDKINCNFTDDGNGKE